MKKVTVFEPKPNAKEQYALNKIHVCAYCRVSSTHKEQLNSFEAQVNFITD